MRYKTARKTSQISGEPDGVYERQTSDVGLMAERVGGGDRAQRMRADLAAKHQE